MPWLLRPGFVAAACSAPPPPPSPFFLVQFKREKRRLFPLWALLSLLQPAYIVWKMAEIFVLFPTSYKAYVKAPSAVLGMLVRLSHNPFL